MLPPELLLFDEKYFHQIIRLEREGNENIFRAILFQLYSAGVVSYTVDCVARTVTYYGADDVRITQY